MEDSQTGGRIPAIRAVRVAMKPTIDVGVDDIRILLADEYQRLRRDLAQEQVPSDVLKSGTAVETFVGPRASHGSPSAGARTAQLV